MTAARLVAIFTAPEAGAAMVERAEAEAVVDHGLTGDRYGARRGTYSGQRRPDADRAVTLIEAEAVVAAAAEAGIELAPGETRRNLVTEGVALNDLVGRTFSVGDVVLRGTDLAHPCAALEARTRPGVLRALTGRGGLRCAIVTGGVLRPGDPIVVDEG